MMVVFFFNDTATTEIYTLSLHDALPIYRRQAEVGEDLVADPVVAHVRREAELEVRLDGVEPVLLELVGLELVEQADRKSTRLNSSHANISYAVFCLKKKKITR